MDITFNNIEFERAAEIAYCCLKANIKDKINLSLQSIITEQSFNIPTFFIDGDLKPFYLLKIEEYKVIFQRKDTSISIYSIFSGDFN